MDQMVQNIKILSGNTNEALIGVLVNKTKVEIALYCKKDYTPAMDNVCEDMVLVKLNRIGAEGLASQSFSGASESYTDQYPDSILKQLGTFKPGVKFA